MNMAMDVETYRALWLDHPAPDSVNGCSNADVMTALNHPGDQIYHPCPEAQSPKAEHAGTLLKVEGYRSEIYPATTRTIWIHKPVDADRELPVIVFADGHYYLSQQGQVRAAYVLDNMTAKQRALYPEQTAVTFDGVMN